MVRRKKKGLPGFNYGRTSKGYRHARDELRIKEENIFENY